MTFLRGKVQRPRLIEHVQKRAINVRGGLDDFFIPKFLNPRKKTAGELSVTAPLGNFIHPPYTT
jgi:hypothetical protein